MVRRIYAEKKAEYGRAENLRRDINAALGVGITRLRDINFYDAENLDDKDLSDAVAKVFSEPPVDDVFFEFKPAKGTRVFAYAALPGQYDQRSDSAAQCLQLLNGKERITVRAGRILALAGLSDEEFTKVKNYIINPIENAEVPLRPPVTLTEKIKKPEPVKVAKGFNTFDTGELERYRAECGFAVSGADLAFMQDYFKSEGREPTETELKVIDTYWSDHCRHTTFLTELTDVEIKSGNPHIKAAYERYRELFNKHYKNRPDKYPCLMDAATMAMRECKARGLLDDLDESDEINACSVKVDVPVDGKIQKYLVMFKNETHNHPTEIEPFGGASTCLGGAIRDPLSGRTWVYQAMRVSGAGDITEGYDKKLAGKLSQRYISQTAAAGYSSYGNQIGLATGLVAEVYHEGYKAKRLECGFVIGAGRAENIKRAAPQSGDVVVMIGGATGRDGIGGATGSSKEHGEKSLTDSAAEVQKGNPVTERKIQRLFRNPDAARLIKKCNDFGAGGVSVAVGELADGLVINLNALPKKYEGLSGTELAVSESQERMAVVVDRKDADKFISLAAAENLDAVAVAEITDKNRLQMLCDGRLIVDISRDFLNTNGVKQKASARITPRPSDFFNTVADGRARELFNKKEYSAALASELSRKEVASQKGMGERFDGSIGAGSVYMPFGGRRQATPAPAMAAKIPTEGETDICTVCSYGFNPRLMSADPFTGAVYSVVESLSKLAVCGVDTSKARLTLQEYFNKLGSDPDKWGEALSALLGAFAAQDALGIPAIGGKDSMSGSFKNAEYDLSVPPTLISFAVGVGRASELITNVLSENHGRVYRLKIAADGYGMPDFTRLKNMYAALYAGIKDGNVTFAAAVGEGGYGAALAKSAFGNGVGIKFLKYEEMLLPRIGDILFSCKDPSKFKNFAPDLIAETAPYTSETAEWEKAFTSTFAGVFPPVPAPVSDKNPENITYTGTPLLKRHKTNIARPRVLLPVFPGNNCEYDTAKKFRAAGAEPVIYIVKNRSVSDIEESVREMARLIKTCQIITFAGGFSGGDEPDGSGKFIAAAFNNPRLKEATEELLNKRDGLILGICNGFQALIKLGLVPYGEIRPLGKASPTLTYNTAHRLVSSVTFTRVCSVKSPWLAGVKVGEVYAAPAAHGEGRFVADERTLNDLTANGQIAAQYADLDGNATRRHPFNPNGSALAAEGITSADGRVFGKMLHNERTGANLYKNVTECSDMKIFESGVGYFK